MILMSEPKKKLRQGAVICPYHHIAMKAVSTVANVTHYRCKLCGTRREGGHGLHKRVRG